MLAATLIKRRPLCFPGQSLDCQLRKNLSSPSLPFHPELIYTIFIHPPNSPTNHNPLHPARNRNYGSTTRCIFYNSWMPHDNIVRADRPTFSHASRDQSTFLGADPSRSNLDISLLSTTRLTNNSIHSDYPISLRIVGGTASLRSLYCPP